MTILQDVIIETTKNGRICPQPQRWKELWEMLPNKQRKGGGWEPPLPLILAAWWDTSVFQKQMRLREHADWAANHDCLGAVYDFLRSLSEADWYHGQQESV